MVISATVGSGVLLLSGAIRPAGFWPTWAAWWTGDAMGILLVAPFLLSLRPQASRPALTLRQGAELGGLLAGTAVVTYLLFQNRLRLEYLVFPLIMASAWRFLLRGAAPAALIASGVAVWSAVHGSGPFATETLFEKMVTLQVFNVTVALASFVLASFVGTREREEQMARLYASERLANEAKTAFLNMAAHELRTPIAVLTGYLSMLADGSLGDAPPAWARSVGVLGTKTRELNKIVDDLLEAARLDGHAVRRTPSELDLRRVVREAVDRARPRADLLGAVITVGTPSEAVSTTGDAGQLGRVLDNLINNSLTYTVRPPRLSVTLTINHSQAMVRLADNGIGIPVSDRERVFERFHRSSNPALSAVPGTGLGLFISRELVRGHGGSLVVESSTPGEGTVFALALPLAGVAG